MSPAPDDLDSLLASLLASVAEAAPAPEEIAPTQPPELSAEAMAVQAALRAWLDSAAPGSVFNPPALDPPTSEAEPLDADVLLELAAARAWQTGDKEAFDEALARLPADRAQHHRRMASVCEMIKTRQQARAAPAPTPGRPSPPPPPPG